MRQVSLTLIGFGIGQVLAEAAIAGSVRSWIAFGFLVTGISLMIYGDYFHQKNR